MNVKLPLLIGKWSLVGPAKRVQSKAIFDYMDGAGELYLGYRFKWLDVYQYKGPDQDEILVELYWMETSDDAWGLLSGDWGGENEQLNPAAILKNPGEIRALYGAGLLRLWSGDLYARVLTYQESAESKQAVLEIGRAIIADRPETDAPLLTRSLPRTIGMQFFLRTDRVVFLRSHLVLNSVYFLSQENLLDLGLGSELAAATYSGNGESTSAKPVRLFLVRYADESVARKALDHFQRVYLSGKSISKANQGTAVIEDGWLGFVRSGRGLGLIFEAPDEATARLSIERAKQALNSLEVPND